MEKQIKVGEVFTLIDENDEEQEVEVIATLEVDDSSYIAVSFAEELEEEKETFDVFFLRIDDAGELEAIESDEEFEKIAAAFEQAMSDQQVSNEPHNHD